MTTIHISKDELERNPSGVLTLLDGDTVVLIEDGANPVAILQPPPKRELSLNERLEWLRGHDVMQDEAFADDLDAAIASRRESFDSSILD